MSPKTTNTSKSTTKARPFLKWVGGKRQLLELFQTKYPKELKQGKIKRYYEPFVGGGAVFFDISHHYPIQTAQLFDINHELILIYRVIQSDLEKLLHFLNHYQEQYLPLPEEDRKSYFYEIRNHFNTQQFDIDYETYNENWISRAAQAIFLNKTCFNGLFRMNSKGEFNTPSGRYKNPTICDTENLTRVNEVLQNAEVSQAPFHAIENHKMQDAFVYFDPPYRPISNTSSFTSYSKDGFGDEKQQELAEVFKRLDARGAKLMLSNSDPKNHDPNDNFFEELYAGFNIQRIPARRSVNSKAEKRGTINEILITNY